MNKNCIILTLLLSCCLQANSQDYLQLANDCFEKGDYECAKRNYTIYQTWDGRDMSAQIQKTDECIKALILADNYFKDAEYEKARERYQIVLEKNPKDPHAKKQFGLCEEYLKSTNNQSQKNAKQTNQSSISNKKYDDQRTNLQKNKKRFHYGLKVGLNVSSMEQIGWYFNGYSYENAYIAYDYKAGIHGGVFGEFRFNKFAIQPELLYSRQGGKNAVRDYFTIPVMAKYYFIEGLCIEIGPQLGSWKIYIEDFNCAINVGTSYQIPRIPLGFTLRYSHDVYRNSSWLPKNRVFQVGAFVKF